MHAVVECGKIDNYCFFDTKCGRQVANMLTHETKQTNNYIQSENNIGNIEFVKYLKIIRRSHIEIIHKRILMAKTNKYNIIRVC